MNKTFQKWSRWKSVGLPAILTVAATFIGCQDEGNNPDPGQPSTLAPLHTQGTQWVDNHNQPVVLKGVNLGNWLLQEFWMMGQETDQIGDQCSLEAVLDDRFGFAERERLMDQFRDNWITDRDWDLLDSFGINVVRLPFIWNLIEDEHNPMTLRDDAWQYLDYAIDEAEKRDIYVILDLHGAVGAQGWEHHSGCAGLNEYWDNEEYQARTRWLWQQIATRYRDRSAVAAYGVLNEPWGTTPANLATESIELYDAIRDVDADKVVILPGHSAGIDAYEKPEDIGLTNVALEMHFYPGIFGWGEIGYAVHRDWLKCGVDGNGGICEWDARLQEKNVPFLVGEMQPWTGLGLELGAEITQATYDHYGDLGWASTAWSYKLITNEGGQGSGRWGMVTNKETLGLLAKADTWTADCNAWDSTLANACTTPATEFTPDRSGINDYYFVVKFGASANTGALDVTVDGLSIKNVDTGEELLINGEFGSSTGWTSWAASTLPTLNFAATDPAKLPAGSDGTALHMTGSDVNGGIYQRISLDASATYRLAGTFKRNDSQDTWAEFYLVEAQPVNGIDVLVEGPFAAIDFNTASKETIETLFNAFGDMAYDIHEPLRDAMTADQRSALFDLPDRPLNVALQETADQVTLTWDASATPEKTTGYNVYRSTSLASGYQPIATNLDALVYVDTNVSATQTYYYRVHAMNEQDESFASDVVHTALKTIPVPGLIEAEDMSNMLGIQIETCSDIGGGENVGYMDPDDFLEYSIDVAEAGTYDIAYRVASGGGSSGDQAFQIMVNGTVLDTQSVPDTGDWQNWQTITGTVGLAAGVQTLRIQVLGGSWNLNWLDLTRSVVP
ncbi:cellulase family glycosylhydrolase [Reinekea blandensis]|uniref:Endoglucanase n=1 Tax=Reinekea blandensis MED297 TaxID=314283 RepID=A4BHQ0_9GAMM|nr:carbohydrate-binding protein [Reinekea blandensis]EAR08305.1 Endoglucanase [Reinekea sp. MED297] [Reinekea blandensis MED297]